MNCVHVEVHPGVWVCPKCDHKAVTSHPPLRQCGSSKAVVKPVAVAKRVDPRDRSGTCKHRGEKLRQERCKTCQSGNGRPFVDLFQCAIHGECTLNNTSIFPRPKACSICEDFVPLVQLTVPPKAVETIPVRSIPDPWRGVIARKPWEYDVTAIIPVLEPDKSLTLVIELLRLQTERPYILLVDTGSSPESTAWIESLRADDVEVHLLRMNAVCHPSEPVSIALDAAVARVQTKYTFYTHSDCFLRKRTALAELKEMAFAYSVVGHQISPRPYDGWESELGHTLLMVDQELMNAAGVTWSMREAMRFDGTAEFWPDYNRSPGTPNYPDTETNFNRMLAARGITPHFTGTEENYQRNVDEWIDHVRSHAGSKIYSADYHAKAEAWLPAAIAEAKERIEAWKNGTTVTPPQEPVNLEGINGWFNFADFYASVFARLRQRKGPIRILEIGVFEGKSTCYLADLIRRSGVADRFEFHCADLFTVHEQYTPDGIEPGQSFRHIAEGNLERLGLSDFVQVHQGKSQEVLEEFPDWHFDFIFVDGDHSLPGVLHDIEIGKRKLKPNGILAGHDLGLDAVRSALRTSGLDYVHHEACDVWEVTGTRGVCYVSWGEFHLAETIKSAKSCPYKTCLFTDLETVVPDGIFGQVIRSDFKGVEGLHHFYRKLVAIKGTPFDTTMYADGDTIFVGDTDLGFKLAQRHDFAAVIAPGGIFHWQSREYVHYNCGALWFKGKPKKWANHVRELAKTFTDCDEPAWSIAWDQLGISPAVLPGVFNLVVAGKIHDRPIRLWHSREEPRTHLISQFEEIYSAVK